MTEVSLKRIFNLTIKKKEYVSKGCQNKNQTQLLGTSRELNGAFCLLPSHNETHFNEYMPDTGTALVTLMLSPVALGLRQQVTSKHNNCVIAVKV